MRWMILPAAVVTGLVLLWVLFYPDDPLTSHGPKREQPSTADRAPAKSTPSVALPPGTLTKDEVTSLFSGMTVESLTVTKKLASITYYDASGEVRQLRDGSKRLGYWRVRKDGRICLQMEDLKEKCRIIVRRLGGGYRKYIVRKNGLHQPTVDYIRFVKGDRLGI